METLLVEIGTEEIPAGYIEPALKSMALSLVKKLDHARIKHGSFETYGTPRRLALKIFEVADKQDTFTTEVVGPPAKIGYNKNGVLAIAGEKFAEKIGIPKSKINIRKTEKGEYLCAKITKRGKTSITVLKNVLPEVILAASFPKSMKWSDLNVEFARPIHSIAALFGQRIISFNLGNIKSGRYIYGHSFMAPKKIKLSNTEQYLEKLRSAYVFADIKERKELVKKEIVNAAASVGGSVLSDEELVDIVTNLVEQPKAVVGSFEERFLKLPDEVLITSMREHQKYFAVIDKMGKLMPYFIAANNTFANDMKVVTRGHERVIRARLEDAIFFYKSDLKIKPETRIEKLKGVLFQEKLGTMYEKVQRVEQVAEFLANILVKTDDEELKQDVLKAVWLCKSDLVSHIVIEFPKLQGVMGRIYASIAKEKNGFVLL